MHRWIPGFVVVAALAGCDSDLGIAVYNDAPSAVIDSPVDGQIFDEGATVSFLGTVFDDQDVEDLEVSWSSSIDGQLPDLDPPDTAGLVEFATASLSSGIHIITLRAIDSHGDQGEDQITLEVLDVPDLPHIEILRPQVDEQGLENFPFIFVAEVSDNQDAAENLEVQMGAAPGGLVCEMVPDGVGQADCDAILPIGAYILNFAVTDSDGNTVTARREYEVVSQGDFDADGDGFSPNAGDCDDHNHTVYPGAPEVCDGIDNDCNVLTAIDVGTLCYDDDADGYCEQPPCVNTAETLPDCNDALYSVSPGAPEILDGIDNDCDGIIDEGTASYDDDGDGYCEAPPCVNAAGLQSDCNDSEYTISPGVGEICNDGIDNNCDGTEQLKDAIGCVPFFYDNDGDTFGVPGPTECYCGDGQSPYTGLDTQDCYDSNPAVYPGQTQYFASHRGDFTFDYDCSGAGERLYRGVTGGCDWDLEPFDCRETSDGWEGSEPLCGQSGSWLDDCDGDYDIWCLTFNCLFGGLANCPQCWSCDPDPYTRTQLCR